MSYVYFIEAVGINKIKIGYSDKPYDRLRQLSTGSPVELKLMKVIPGTMELERKLHKQFKDYRSNGEWFYASIEILNYLKILDSSDRMKQLDDIIFNRVRMKNFNTLDDFYMLKKAIRGYVEWYVMQYSFDKFIGKVCPCPEYCCDKAILDDEDMILTHYATFFLYLNNIFDGEIVDDFGLINDMVDIGQEYREDIWEKM